MNVSGFDAGSLFFPATGKEKGDNQYKRKSSES
jgi:hypothetical protein